MDISLKISLFSLVFSLVALIWNIVRDILLDKVSVSRHMFVGAEITDDKGVKRLIPAGTKINILGTGKTISAEKVFFNIINTGRRDIEIDCIIIEYKNGSCWLLPISEKRYLKPYESVNANTDNNELRENIKKHTIKSAYVKDTKNKKWYFSESNIDKIQTTLN